METSDVRKEQDDKKPMVEENSSGNLRNKQTGKQAKDSSNSGETPKENYIHVRARRGQATNSHSLAERVLILLQFILLQIERMFRSLNRCSEAITVSVLQVRREKISERMRLLQELVPGCNKVF